MGKLIFEKPKAKVYENDNGTYTVQVLRTWNFDGFIESCWSSEVFEEDGIHCGGGVCTHNFPIRYSSENKPLKERALEYAVNY